MSRRAESIAPIRIVELENFNNRLVVDFPRLARVDHSQVNNSDNAVGRGNGKSPRNYGNGNGIKKSGPDEPEDGLMDKSKGKNNNRKDIGKSKLRNGRRINCNVIGRALSPK
jgi:hypothetical protein